MVPTQIFVRQKETHLLLGLDATWVAAPSCPHLFKNTAEAHEFCVANNVHRAEIVMRIGDDPEYDVIIAVGKLAK